MIDTERISFPNSRGDMLVGVLHHPMENHSTGAAILCHGLYDTIAFVRFASGKSRYAKVRESA